jgi:hypothetical protein
MPAMPDAPKPHTLVTVDPQLHRRLKMRCAELSVPMKSVVDDLIAAFLHGEPMCTITAIQVEEQLGSSDQ